MSSLPSTMRALQYRAFGEWPRIVEVERPRPGPGQVLLRVTAAGVCHSDIGLLTRPRSEYPYGALPQTLGHEGAGIVAQIGDGVTEVQVEDDVLVYGPRGCGRCRSCMAGAENLCPAAPRLGLRSPGLGAPGTMADFLLVDHPRHLVPLHDLDPVQHVSLSDAGLTPYHALRRSWEQLTAGRVVVIIGVGGLGHVAVQLVPALTACVTVAVEIDEAKRARAIELGAHHAVAPDQAADLVSSLSGGDGACVVLDLVGSPTSTALATQVAGRGADINVIGVGRGAVSVGYGTIATDVSVRFPYWGTRPELLDVLAMARDGRIHVDVETCGLDDASLAYRRLHDGLVAGRAVVVP